MLRLLPDSDAFTLRLALVQELGLEGLCALVFVVLRLHMFVFVNLVAQEINCLCEHADIFIIVILN